MADVVYHAWAIPRKSLVRKKVVKYRFDADHDLVEAALDVDQGHLLLVFGHLCWEAIALGVLLRGDCIVFDRF